jgi:hypothetical protein
VTIHPRCTSAIIAVYLDKRQHLFLTLPGLAQFSVLAAVPWKWNEQARRPANHEVPQYEDSQRVAHAFDRRYRGKRA